MKINKKYTNVIFENPYFKDAKNFDFTIVDSSPVIKNGFVPWNYNEAGTIYNIKP